MIPKESIQYDASEQASSLGALQLFAIRPRNLAGPWKVCNLEALV